MKRAPVTVQRGDCCVGVCYPDEGFQICRNRMLSRLDIIDSLLPVHDHQYDSLFKSNGLAALVFPKT
jgi:hypothetical protein